MKNSYTIFNKNCLKVALELGEQNLAAFILCNSKVYLDRVILEMAFENKYETFLNLIYNPMLDQPIIDRTKPGTTVKFDSRYLFELCSQILSEENRNQYMMYFYIY